MTDALADESATAAVARALEAAQLATDAAHEAEAVILARSEANAAMARTARRTTLLAALVGGAALVGLLAGTTIWWRASSDLHDAAAVQAEAAAAFVARLAEMNTALDRMDAATTAAATDQAGLAAQVAQMSALLAARLPDEAATGASLPQEGAFAMRMDALRADILAAITESELSMAERLVQLAAQTPLRPEANAPQITPRPSPVATQVAPRPVARPAEGRPAQAAPKPANPFRYP